MRISYAEGPPCAALDLAKPSQGGELKSYCRVPTDYILEQQSSAAMTLNWNVEGPLRSHSRAFISAPFAIGFAERLKLIQGGFWRELPRIYALL